MLRIGKSYITRIDGISRLCANLTIRNHRITLWFAVDSTHENWLTLGRADAFVMAMLPNAMQGGHEIICEDPMSERLHHQMTDELIPTLAFVSEKRHLIKITAPLTSEKIPNEGAVGTGFSGGVDCLYTIMRHGPGSELPLSHIAVINRDVNIWDENTFNKIYQRAKLFGREQRLKAVSIDTNYKKVVSANADSIGTFRFLSCALAMQGLFKTYLISSGPNASKMVLDLDICDHYDLLTVNCAATESISFYLSGAETTRDGKLAALSQWEPSWHWMNACIIKEGEDLNCGHCKKCIHDMTMLYALGQLEKYQSVFDLTDYYKHLPARIGYVLAGRNDSVGCAQAAQLLEERNIEIPKAAYLYEEQFLRAKQRSKR